MMNLNWGADAKRLSPYWNTVWKTFTMEFLAWFTIASMMTNINFTFDGYYFMLAPIWSGFVLLMKMIIGLLVYFFPFSSESDAINNPNETPETLRGYRDFLWLGHAASLYVWFVGLPISLYGPWWNFTYFFVIMLILMASEYYRYILNRNNNDGNN